MEVTDVLIRELNNAKYNPRKITDEELDGLRYSLKTFGFVDPVIVNKRNMTIVGGHMRTRAAESLGYEKVPVHFVDLSDAEEKALNIALNSQAISGKYDDAILKPLLEEIKLAMPDHYEALRFDVIEPPELKIEQLDPGKEDEGSGDLPAQPKTKHGDIWIMGAHRVMCGDATIFDEVEKLLNGNEPDMVYTDPPYGMSLNVDYDSMFKGDKSHKKKGDRFQAVKGDDAYFDPSFIINQFFNNEVFLWGADYFYDSLPRGGSWVAWDKRIEENMDKVIGNTTEFLWSMKPHRRMTARVLWSGHHGMGKNDEKSRVHPTQKPVALHEWFFENFGNKKTLILDLFLGSGSCLIACQKVGKTCYGMELDASYCDVIVKRWEKMTGQKATLESTGETYEEVSRY